VSGGPQRCAPRWGKAEGLWRCGQSGEAADLYERCANILNKAMGRQLNSVECCLLIDEAAACVVAGNIRRSAGMRQFDSDDDLAAAAKDNLWQQDEEGNWRIDPERDALRMANHTRVFHHKPTLEE
jgi:ribonucleotide reductase class II